MEINNTELVILGLLAESEQYGYELEKCIEQRGMRAWTDIGFSSIYYAINRMEQAGQLESRRTLSTSRPARKIYHLTEKGRVCLGIAVKERLAAPRPRTADFDLALANLPALPQDEVIGALQTFQVSLAARLQDVENKRNADRQAGLPPHVEALFNHCLAQLQAEREWVQNYIEFRMKESKYG